MYICIPPQDRLLTLYGQTFFSTDVIKYQNQGDGDGPPDNGSFSSTAMKRWLQVTIPLTAITLLIAWMTYKISESARQGAKPATNASSHSEQQSQNTTKSQSPGLSRRQSTLRPIQDLVKGLKTNYYIMVAHRNKAPTLPLHNTSKGAN